jgi:hypothetical protein
MGEAASRARGASGWSDFDHHRLVVGYHGCDREVGEKALLGREGLKESINEYDWLGHGIYFWEHGPQRAMEWAVEIEKRDRGRETPRVREPFVIGAYIYLGRCLDLLDTQHTEKLKFYYEKLKRNYDLRQMDLPVNTEFKRNLDCAVLNSLFAITDASIVLRQRENLGPVLEGASEGVLGGALAGEGQQRYYQTVRGGFHEGDDAFPGSKIRLKTHIQISVRDPACILGYFKPNRGVP